MPLVRKRCLAQTHSIYKYSIGIGRNLYTYFFLEKIIGWSYDHPMYSSVGSISSPPNRSSYHGLPVYHWRGPYETPQ